MKITSITTCLLLAISFKTKAEPPCDNHNQKIVRTISRTEKTINYKNAIQRGGIEIQVAGNAYNAKSAAKKSVGSNAVLHTNKIITKKQIKMTNAKILHTANECVKKGDYEGFLNYCTQATKWIFVGERVLEGKNQVREYMTEFYLKPPVFNVEKTIEDGDFVTVLGEISLKDTNGVYHHYDYCDVWRFENGKIAALKAFVIEKNPAIK